MAQPRYSCNRFPFGKHKGRYLHQLPPDYVAWVRGNVELFDQLAREMEFVWGGEFRRKGDGYRDDPQRGATQLPIDFRSLRRRLSIQHHPDRGGNVDVMRGINIAFDVIEKIQEAGG